MNIYHYHPETRVYSGTSPADESPLEPGVFLVPAQATDVQPPTVKNNKRAVWNTDNNEWEIRDIPQLEPESKPSRITWVDIRNQRNAFLRECDWTQLPDAPLSGQQQAMWTAYRQTLRDLPEIFTRPESIQWPKLPEFLQ